MSNRVRAEPAALACRNAIPSPWVTFARVTQPVPGLTHPFSRPERSPALPVLAAWPPASAVAQALTTFSRAVALLLKPRPLYMLHILLGGWGRLCLSQEHPKPRLHPVLGCLSLRVGLSKITKV